jgi:hypothetical protein
MALRNFYADVNIKGEFTSQKLTIENGYSFPIADGITGQILATNGLGVLQFVNPSSLAILTTASIINGTGITWSQVSPGVLQGNINLSSFSTSNLIEGTRLYFTNNRADNRVAAVIGNGTGLTWTYSGPGNNTLVGNINLSPFSTSNLSEGTNLYFTNERVDDRVAALLKNGTTGTGPAPLSWIYNDPLNILTPVISLAPFNTDALAEGIINLYFTNNRAISAVAGALQNSPTITWSYNSILQQITATANVPGTPLTVEENGSVIGSRSTLNFIDGLNTTVSISEDVLNNKINVQIDSSGGGTSPYGEPWGIFDTSGNVTTYPTFSAAKAAANPLETIHMFCNVTENSDITLDVSGVAVDFNGHIYTLDVDSDTPAITASSNTESFLYNGVIIRAGATSTLNSSPAGGGIVIYSEAEILHLNGLLLASSNDGDSIGIYGRTTSILSNNITVTANSYSGTAYPIYVDDSDAITTTRISNIHIFDGGTIYVNRAILSNITGVIDVLISEDSNLSEINVDGRLVILRGRVINSSFLNSTNGENSITLTGTEMINVNGINENITQGNGILITGNISGSPFATLFNCYGEGYGDLSSGISIKDCAGTEYLLDNCTGVGKNEAAGIELDGADSISIVNSRSTSDVIGLSVGSTGGNHKIINITIDSQGAGALFNNNQTIYQGITINSTGDGDPGLELTQSNIIVNGFNIISNGIGILCGTGSNGSQLINGNILSIKDDTRAHGIILQEACKVIKSSITVTNSIANCLYSEDPITASYAQNYLAGASTSITANITQGISDLATIDNKGNISV